MKIIFVQTSDRFFADTQMFGIHCMPVWAYTLAAHLATVPDVETVLFDDRFERVEDVPPADLFLFTGINQDHEAILRSHRSLKQRFPRARFVIGGTICWSFNAAGKIGALDMFDHVVIGDGEDAVRRLVEALRHGDSIPRVIEVGERFDLRRALPMHRALLEQTISRYYGAVLEVSRGCPFLCEFCDIRVLPDNNRAHVKDPALIVAELDTLYELGCRQILFACDNFIGDQRWAEEVCDRIIRWQETTGRSVSLYTWLTINVAKQPTLLRKLRLAGFDLFFIGVESFNQSSLLETAKVQNTTVALVQSLRAIQSYGFVVVAGLIFGFDNDPDDVADITLRGIMESGLISGDPSLLTALPGTPLYARMQLSGRLREGKIGLGGFKYQTNIKYLKAAGAIRADFKTFVKEFNRGPYQYRRLMSFYACVDSERYVTPRTPGYADLTRLLSLTAKNMRSLRLLWLRLFRLLLSSERAFYIGLALARTFWLTSRERPLWFYLKFWLFNWSNAIVKYAELSDADFDVESVPRAFPVEKVLPESYEALGEAWVPAAKMRAQRRVTAAALRQFVQARVERV